jgi:hypothetical protein
MENCSYHTDSSSTLRVWGAQLRSTLGTELSTSKNLTYPVSTDNPPSRCQPEGN